MANMYLDDEPPPYLYAATLLAAERLSQQDSAADTERAHAVSTQLAAEARSTQQSLADQLHLSRGEDPVVVSHEEAVYHLVEQFSPATAQAARIAAPRRAQEIPEMLLSLDDEQRTLAETLGEEFAHNTAAASHIVTTEEPHTLLLNAGAITELQQNAETAYGFSPDRVRTWILRSAVLAQYCAPAAASNAFSTAWNATSLKEAGEALQREHGEMFSEEQHEALHAAASDETHPLRHALEGDLQLSYHREVIARIPALIADLSDTSSEPGSVPLSLYIPPPKITMRPSENLPHAEFLTRGILAHLGVAGTLNALGSHDTQILPDEAQKLLSGEAHAALKSWRQRQIRAHE